MPISLDEEQQEVVTAEAKHFARRVLNPKAKAVYNQIYQSAQAGQMEDTQAGSLGEILSLGLISGRIRSRYGAHAEKAAATLFRRTPQGKDLQEQFREINGALKMLEGNTIHQLRLSARGPGLYSFVIDTSDYRLVISLGPDGVDVRSLEISV